MNIICSTDDNYVLHCCVMLYSFFQHNPEEGHSIFVLSEGLTQKNLLQLEDLVSKCKGNMVYCKISSEDVADFPISPNDHLSIVTYYRLLMADVLPDDIDKVLYLDCDIVINSSLQELWRLDVSQYALAAMEERGSSAKDVYERLQYESSYGYFNAGVLLINLDYWRKNKVSKLCSNYVLTHRDILVAHDQDVLNALFHDCYLQLDCQWNVEEAFYHYCVLQRENFNKSFLHAICNPKILHYTWKPKPWHEFCRHPYRHHYYRCLCGYLNNNKAVSTKQWKRAWKDYWRFRLLLWLKIKDERLYKLK